MKVSTLATLLLAAMPFATGSALAGDRDDSHLLSQIQPVPQASFTTPRLSRI